MKKMQLDIGKKKRTDAGGGTLRRQERTPCDTQGEAGNLIKYSEYRRLNRPSLCY